MAKDVTGGSLASKHAPMAGLNPETATPEICSEALAAVFEEELTHCAGGRLDVMIDQENNKIDVMMGQEGQNVRQVYWGSMMGVLKTVGTPFGAKKHIKSDGNINPLWIEFNSCADLARTINAISQLLDPNRSPHGLQSRLAQLGAQAVTAQFP